MNFCKRFGMVSALLTIAFLSACGGGGGSDVGTGTLSFALADSSCSSYAAVYVTIDEVQVNKTDGNSGWRTVANPMKTYNLLRLINGVTEVLGEDELEAGFYKQIRLIIGKTAESENNIFGVPHPYANYVLFEDGTTESLKIPSGYNTGIKLVHNFEVIEDSFVELLLDFEACRSVVETGSGKYILKPTINVIETLSKFDVFGTVTNIDTDLPVTGAIVSAQISEGLSASVVRSTLTSSDDGSFRILLSPEQTYNIVVYSDDKLGDPGSLQVYAPECAEVTIPSNEDIEQNFELELFDYGSISGNVSFSDTIDPEDLPVIYIKFFSMLGCGYVEVTSLWKSPNQDTHTFSYSVDLPIGEYDIVASLQGFVPRTVTGINLNTGDSSTVNFDF